MSTSDDPRGGLRFWNAEMPAVLSQWCSDNVEQALKEVEEEYTISLHYGDEVNFDPPMFQIYSHWHERDIGSRVSLVDLFRDEFGKGSEAAISWIDKVTGVLARLREEAVAHCEASAKSVAQGSRIDRAFRE